MLHFNSHYRMVLQDTGSAAGGYFSLQFSVVGEEGEEEGGRHSAEAKYFSQVNPVS